MTVWAARYPGPAGATKTQIVDWVDATKLWNAYDVRLSLCRRSYLFKRKDSGICQPSLRSTSL